MVTIDRHKQIQSKYGMRYNMNEWILAKGKTKKGKTKKNINYLRI